MHLAELRHYKKEIIALADKYGAENIRVFGSMIRKEETDESDVDFLVRLRPGTSLMELAALHRELRSLLGVPVDVLSEKGVSKYLKEKIFDEALPL